MCCRWQPVKTINVCWMTTRPQYRGGMGAYSPAPVVTPDVYERAMNEIILPTVAGMKAEGPRVYRLFFIRGLDD